MVPKKRKKRKKVKIQQPIRVLQFKRERESYWVLKRERDIRHSYFSFHIFHFSERERESERLRESQREKEREIPWGRAPEQPRPIYDLRATTRGKWRVATRGERRAATRGERATTTRWGRRATERAAPASDVTVSLWVWFALGLGFGLLCIGFIFW